jgi:hypothetical protein
VQDLRAEISPSKALSEAAKPPEPPQLCLNFSPLHLSLHSNLKPARTCIMSYCQYVPLGVRA